MEPGPPIPQPQWRESWRYHPFSVGVFLGMAQGGPLINDWVGLKQGLVGGVRLGWDFSSNWGAETRFTFADVALYDNHDQPEGAPTPAVPI